MTARLSSPAVTESAPQGQGSRSGVPFSVWCAGILLLVLGVFGGHAKPADDSRTSHDAAALMPWSTPVPGKHLPSSAPTRLVIPKIGVDAPFTALSVDAKGHLNPPPADNVNMVGWYADGVTPGEAGTSIVAGHVDTKTSAAVFARLSSLKKGDTFRVEKADGLTASFVVDDAETFEKDHFPNDRVYADTPQAQVRLITCAGDYDHSAKDYTENLVVFAHLV
ncbi:class F sortase [Streptomyces sp. NPDC005122]